LGGLMSYGINYSAVWRRSAAFVDKILKGVNRATLPIELPQFELALNLRTARALGIKIPPEILLEANEVIK
jgi:putative ABC transport system substrate-binding protein